VTRYCVDLLRTFVSRLHRSSAHMYRHVCRAMQAACIRAARSPVLILDTIFVKCLRDNMPRMVERGREYICRRQLGAARIGDVAAAFLPVHVGGNHWVRHVTRRICDTCGSFPR